MLGTLAAVWEVDPGRVPATMRVSDEDTIGKLAGRFWKPSLSRLGMLGKEGRCMTLGRKGKKLKI